MSSTNTQTSTPQKLYSAPGVANLPYHQRPLPPGWISQFDSTYQAYFYIDENTNPPTITWEDPRPAYYMAQERGQYAPPPPGIQSSPSSAHQRRSPQPQQQQQQQQAQTVHTIQNADGTITTLTSSGNQPIIIQSPAPQQQQPQVQQVHSSGPSVGRTIVGAAVVGSLLRPRPRVIVAPRRRFR